MKRLLLTLFLVSFLGCSNVDQVVLTIKTTQFKCEIAKTDEDRANGLMNRSSMPAGSGMLFIFDDERIRHFWMKDTQIPLSIAYIDSQGVIRDILDMQPNDLRDVVSSVPVKYALEVNQGAFAKAGIKVGDRVVDIINLH
jgi:uncharacterized membrane protein (UPF0127 family)